MYAAMVEPAKVAKVLGLRRKVASVEQLEQQVEAGLPKSSLGAVARHVYGRATSCASQRDVGSSRLPALITADFAPWISSVRR